MPGRRVRRQEEPGGSAGECLKADGGIIAHRHHGFQRHVTGTLHGPLIVLFEQDRADQADDGILVGEDADHFGPPFDLAVEAFDRVGGVQLGPVLRGERHVDEHVGLGLVEESGKLGQLGTELIGDLAPLRSCGL